MKVTSFEDYVAAPEEFFRDLFGFFDLADDGLGRALDRISVVAQPNFRLGLTDEWRDVFDNRQKKMMTERISEGVAEFFGGQINPA